MGKRKPRLTKRRLRELGMKNVEVRFYWNEEVCINVDKSGFETYRGTWKECCENFAEDSVKYNSIESMKEFDKKSKSGKWEDVSRGMSEIKILEDGKYIDAPAEVYKFHNEFRDRKEREWEELEWENGRLKLR